MLHIPPREILKLKRQLVVERPHLFIPGLTPCPKIIGAAREVNPGSLSWTSPGTYSWLVPNFNTMIVTVRGAGGGGSSAGWYGGHGWFTGIAGSAGTYSQFYNATYCNIVAYGGDGGPGGSNTNVIYQNGYMVVMPPGANGSASGGDTNSAGGGAAGGSYGYSNWYDPAWGTYGNNYGGNGGYGGSATRTFLPSALLAGSSIQIVVGSGGAPGAISGYMSPYDGAEYPPTWGQNGSVAVSWS